MLELRRKGINRYEIYAILRPVLKSHTPAPSTIYAIAQRHGLNRLTTDETRNMADAGFFAKIKPGAFVVNTSRGGVLDVDALAEALRAGRVAAAALDVMPTEPPGPELPLLQAWRAREEWVRHRLVVTPHAAFYSEEGEHDMRVKAAETVREALDGRPPRNRVNP